MKKCVSFCQTILFINQSYAHRCLQAENKIKHRYMFMMKIDILFCYYDCDLYHKYLFEIHL